MGTIASNRCVRMPLYVNLKRTRWGSDELTRGSIFETLPVNKIELTNERLVATYKV